MHPDKQRKIAAAGGRAAHAKGNAHKWTGGKDGSAAAAGRRGGVAAANLRRQRLEEWKRGRP